MVSSPLRRRKLTPTADNAAAPAPRPSDSLSREGGDDGAGDGPDDGVRGGEGSCPLPAGDTGGAVADGAAAGCMGRGGTGRAETGGGAGCLSARAGSSRLGLGGVRGNASSVAYWVPPDAPDMTSGQELPARVVASDPGPCHGHLGYRKVAWYFPQKGETLTADLGYDHICDPS